MNSNTPSQLELLQLKQVLDHHAIVSIADADGNITYVNDHFCRISKYCRAELIGKNHRIVNSGYHSRTFFQELWAHICSGRVWQGELMNRAKDGSNYWVATTIMPFMDVSGKLIHYLSIRNDITQIKQATANLEKLNRKLQERMDDLLIETQRAEAAVKAKSQFLSNMSHELRTPLNGIILSAEMLVEEELSPQQKHLARTLVKSGEHLLLLVNDVLDYSKIAAGKMTLNQEPFSPASVIQDIVELMQLSAATQGLSLNTQVPENSSLCLGDSARLHQVLFNLVGNAIKFTPGGEIKIKLTQLTGAPTGSQRLRFSVQDCGIGMSPELISRIGEPFTQANDSNTRKFGGTGLGLSICRRLVELMGGQLQIQSQLGVGTEFSFTLEFPLVEAAPAKPRIATKAELRPKTPLRRLLIVDDNPANVDIFQLVARTFAEQVEVAENGAQAVAMVAQHPYDCILMDCQMPVMDGCEATRHIRLLEKQTGRPRTPILAVTGQVDDQNQAACAAAGMDGFLCKPLTTKNLCESIEKWCQSRPSEPQAKPAVMAAIPSAAIPSAKPPSPPLLRRVLIVDDNELNLTLLKFMLKRLAQDVDLAKDGSQALEKFTQHPYDCILMDCQMPVMDGYEATRRIRELEALTSQRRTPILAVTGNASDENRDDCRAAGMDDFMSKPIASSVLMAKLVLWCPST